MQASVRSRWVERAIVAFSLALASCSEGLVGELTVCRHEGREYSVGQSFEAADRCNRCSCLPGGSVGCTQRTCIAEAAPLPAQDAGSTAAPSAGKAGDGGAISSCIVNGQLYREGEQIAIEGSCDRCLCGVAGALSCVQTGCDGGLSCSFEGKSYQSGATFLAANGWSCECEASGQVTCQEDGCLQPGACSYAGVVHPALEKFQTADGCHTCYCDEQGKLQCDSSYCDVEQANCSYDGNVFPPGYEFLALDGCSRCSCGLDGKVACADELCKLGPICTLGGATFAEVSVPCADGCNSCSCKGGQWWSTELACPALPKIAPCTADMVDVPEARILYLERDSLAVDARVPDCKTDSSALELCHDPSWAKGQPASGVLTALLRVVTSASLACPGSVARQAVFDLGPLREQYRAAYPDQPPLFLQLGADTKAYESVAR